MNTLFKLLLVGSLMNLRNYNYFPTESTSYWLSDPVTTAKCFKMKLLLKINVSK